MKIEESRRKGLGINSWKEIGKAFTKDGLNMMLEKMFHVQVGIFDEKTKNYKKKKTMIYYDRRS